VSHQVEHKPVELKTFEMSFPAWILFIVGIVLGVISLYLIAIEDSDRAWFNYLIGTCIFLGLGLAGLFFIMINAVVRAKWMVAMRRLFESMAMTLPIAALLVVGVYLGRDNLFEWLDAAIVAKDPLLQGKVAYLNEPFFVIRLIIMFTFFIGATWYLVRNSFRQDQDGDIKHSVRNYRASAFFLVLFSLTVTAAGFDLLMSLDPHWFSTIYGVYFFAGFFQAGLALAYLTAWYLHRTGVFAQVLNRAHFHELGKYLFAFSVFWAYIGFSQFMLIWYADIPEEAFWYKYRLEHGWEWMAMALPVVRWGIPFVLLLPYANKTNTKIVLPVCILIFFGHWMDVFWNAMPALRLIAHGGKITGLNPPLERALSGRRSWSELGSSRCFLCALDLLCKGSG